MKKIKHPCRSCKQETNHQIVAEHEESGSDEKYDVDWWNKYEILCCLGCETYSFRKVHTNSECRDWETGQFDEDIKIYPPITSSKEPIEDSDEFPAITRKIYLETLTAFSNNALILAAIGVRAIIESVCKDLKTGKRNLEKNIDALAELGHLSDRQAEMLHKHRFMGNIAAHEIKSPNPSHLLTALDIAETLLKTIYVLPQKAAGLSSPPKKAAKNAAKKSPAKKI